MIKLIRALFGLVVIGILVLAAAIFFATQRYPEIMALSVVETTQNASVATTRTVTNQIPEAASNQSDTSTLSADIENNQLSSLPLNTMLSFPRGSTLSSLLAQISNGQSNLSELDQWIVRLYHRYNGDSQKLQAGQYRMVDSVGMPITIQALLAAIIAGDTAQFSVTIPEGRTFAQMREIIESQASLNKTVNELNNTDLLAKITDDYENPEGLFLANTYFYDANTDDLAIYQRAFESLTQSLNQAWENKADNLEIKTPYEALIMASIIEKETGIASERPEISGVFNRRLGFNMRLQTDPTVIYGLGDKYRGTLYRSDLDAKTPYNTYQIDGLPPTPISLVGEDSINAAVQPLEGSSLYFVADGNGGHAFADSLQEHNRNVQSYRKQQSN